MITTLPLQRNISVREDRDTVLLYIRSKTIAGVVNNLSSYTFQGDVKASLGKGVTKICAVRFANDLVNGIVKAYVSEADGDAILAAVGSGGRAYADIVRISATGWDEPLAEITITSKQIVTGVVR